MKKILAFVVAALLALAADDAAFGQAPPTPSYPATLGGSATISASQSSARAALPASQIPYGAVTIFNNGTKDAYFAFGSSSVTATTSSTPLPAGKAITLWMTGTPTHIAAICGSGDTTSVVIYQASGSLGFGP